ncbi:MAG: PEF-CTERM sorting domain-containing protein [Methanosarcinaceae archaeon]|nr:PEF-CTERM sorting domain-containing protein [Methanosarcinaceae archaeon]
MTHNSSFWATTLDKSELVVLYSYGNNRVPCEPSVEIEPSECVDTNDDLTVSITGPSPADPDGDNVTYTYRWFVDTGTGFLDDEFALGVDHTGNMVPAADTSTGQIWMVQVTPVDEYGAKGPFVQVAFNEIVEECGEIPGGEIPEFPTLALPIAAIIGLAFVFQRSRKE